MGGPRVRGSIQDGADGRIYSTESAVSAHDEDMGFAHYNDDYNTIPSYKEALSVSKIEPSDGRVVGKSSSFFAAYNIICTVVGTGLLQLPYGLEESGWSGVIILLAMCGIASYTAIILIKCMNPPSGRKLYTYAQVGEEAMGTPGRWLVNVTLHATLLGVATIYLILAGNNLSYLLNSVPWSSAAADNYVKSVLQISPAWCTVIIAVLVWGHVWLTTLHEVGFLSAFNVCVAVFLFLVVIVEVLDNIPPDRGTHHFVNKAYDGLSLAGAFVSFAFSFGAHAILPTVYETMKKPKQFNVMLTLTFIAILFFYVPMSTVGYYAFGDGTLSPIYDNLCSASDPACTFDQQLGKWLAVFAITCHLMMSFPIILNPTELAFEGLFNIHKFPPAKRKLLSVSLRTCLVILTVLIAEFIPDFSAFLNLVSSCTNTATSFVLPCLFHLIIFWPTVKTNPLIIAVDVFIIIISTVAGIFGATFAVGSILCDVFGVALTSQQSC